MSLPVVIFDLDGVISDTASLHAMAWKAVFDQVLSQHGLDQTPFCITQDYLQYVDGKSRQAGIESFLQSRGIKLSIGEPDDEGLHSVHGIGNHKNNDFRKKISQKGVKIFDDARNLIQTLRENKVTLAIASSSKNAKIILKSGNLLDYFSIIMDGVIAEENGVKSKPDSEFYVYTTTLLGKQPAQCVVIEDAISGVTSAKNAGIGFIVGIARNENHEELSRNGADIVIESLNALSLDDLRINPSSK